MTAKATIQRDQRWNTRLNPMFTCRSINAVRLSHIIDLSSLSHPFVFGLFGASGIGSAELSFVRKIRTVEHFVS